MVSHCQRSLRFRPQAAGFTLIEVLIAIVVVAILTAIAVPQYTEFVRRSRITEATNNLSDFRTRMEQFFQDNRSYANAGNCGVADPPANANAAFDVACSGATATGYQVDATGKASKGMNGFQYRLVVDPATGAVTRTTVSVPTGWTSSGTCWVIRKNGSCS